MTRIQNTRTLDTTVRRYHRLLVHCLAVIALLMSTAAVADITQVDNNELKKLLADGVPLIDVRRPDEWKLTGVVEGSHLLTFFDAKGKYDVKQWLAELEQIAPDNQPFILICAVGGRTGSIANLLDRKLGFTGVHNVTKGIRGWMKAGEPTAAWSP
ncbi:MAG: rhodanese-like domain-containing protein [Gammaproteobacteria bacterium]|nr:rhodanese-like domain-containing protein [Gammaproteobacteria bacterium]